MIDLLIINPSNRHAYTVVSNDLPAIEPPIWAGMLAEYVRQYGYSVRIWDENVELCDIVDEIEQEKIQPRLIAIVVYGHNPSASTQLMPRVEQLVDNINHIQYNNYQIVLIGGHVAALPELTMRQMMITYVAGGEGFETLVGLLNKSLSLEDVSGLYWRKGRQVIHNKPASLIVNIPGVAWDLLPMDGYRAHNWQGFGSLSRGPYASIYTTLGCPFNCHFCCIQAPFREGEKLVGVKKSYRKAPIESIISQIDNLVENYNIKYLKIADELFMFDKKHVTAICNHIIEKQYDINIWAYARLDCLDEDLLNIMRKAGIRWLGVGIESVDDPKISKINVFDQVNKIRDHGIYVGANYMFGLPDDNYISMQKTLDLAIDLNTEWANYNCCYAFPGSRLYEEIENPSTDWSEYTYFSKNSKPMNTKYLSGKQVQKFRDEAFIKYFDREEYRCMLRRTFGQGAVDEVKRMLK